MELSSCFFRGVLVNKDPHDLWAYAQELWARETEIVVETGTQTGGSALWFAMCADCRVFTYDKNDEALKPEAAHKDVLYLGESLTSGLPALDAPTSVSLDSDHTAGHISQELERFAPLVYPGQMLVVEDIFADPKTVAMLGEWEAQHPEFRRFTPHGALDHFAWYERA